MLISGQLVSVDDVANYELLCYSRNLVKFDEVAQERVPEEVVIIFIYCSNLSNKNRHRFALLRKRSLHPVDVAFFVYLFIAESHFVTSE